MNAQNRISTLFLITELNVGGAERIVEQLASQLPRNRYRAQVACLYDPHAIGADIQAAGIPVINLDMQAKWDLRAPYRLLRLLREENVQILHAHLFHAHLLAAIVGKLAGTPVIIATRHSVEIGGQHRETINRWIRPLCDAVVAVSKDVYQAEVQRSGIDPKKVTMIPNGVQLREFSNFDPAAAEKLRDAWSIQPETAIIGTVGRFVTPKGHIYLLDALASLRNQMPDIRALIIGDGPLRSSIETSVKALGLAEIVILTGTRHDIPELLSLLDLFVLPSLWEGLPIAILEAMAAGLPVVATRVGGVPEVVVDGETGLLVPPGDPDALAQAILRLLRDPDLRHRMGQAGRARVAEHFSVEQMVRKTEALYERLLAEKGLL
ncbi:MAG: glycosyltransferase [Chloroflexota bacterium]|nr:glycosyltransferase [Chloroflexota bacterium]